MYAYVVKANLINLLNFEESVTIDFLAFRVKSNLKRDEPPGFYFFKKFLDEYCLRIKSSVFLENPRFENQAAQ
jgi:hypothetical protein